MSSAVIVILFIIFTAIEAQFDGLSCPTSTAKTSSGKLKDAVLCHYDSSVRPVVDNKNATPVSFRIIMKSFDFDILTSKFSVDAWMPMTWNDQHLTWNPSDHDNIQNIYLHYYEIWMPDLSLYNLANQGETPDLVGTVKCIVSFKGEVTCVPPVHIDALCIPNLEKYPFDKQDCSLKIGSWIHQGEEIDLIVNSTVVNTKELTPNGEWELLSHSTRKHNGVFACCPKNTFPSVDVTFTIRRLAGSHAAVVLIPSLVCVILTLILLALSPVDKERLTLGYVNVIANFLQVQNVSFQLPLKGDHMPLIIVFSRDCLLLSLFALLFTFVFRSIMSKKTMPPGWVTIIVSAALATTPGQYLLLNDYSAKESAVAKREEDGVGIVETNNVAENTLQDWKIFGTILDKIFFVVYVAVYFVMMLSLLP